MSAPRVEEAVAALDTLVELGPDRIAEGHLADARALRARIHERLAHGDAVTVVAVAGGTGVGKSALVNRLAAVTVVTEGMRRPTTTHPVAVAGRFDQPLRALLDWLDIHDRRTGGSSLPAGVVLVDLPDHDSVIERHRTTAARLARRVDALVVVVDPIKYARADLHHGPLAELTSHAEVVTVALNRVDEIAAGDAEACLADLTARLHAAGLADAEVLATSAATGVGVAELRERLETLASGRSAAARRLTGDAAQLARRVAADLPEPPAKRLDTEPLIDAVTDATDARRAVADAGAHYRRDATRAARSPLARAARAPGAAVTSAARGLGITSAAAPHRGAGDATSGRSVGEIERALAAALQLDDTAGRTHAALGEIVETTARSAAPFLADAVGGTDLHPARRQWWGWLSWLRGVAEVAALLGLVWLVLLGLAGWLQLPELPTPQLTDTLSWPAALFLYGLAARVLLGLLSRALIGAGAGRHRSDVEHAVRQRLAEALRRHVVEPYEAEVGRYARIGAQLDVLHGRSGTERSWECPDQEGEP